MQYLSFHRGNWDVLKRSTEASRAVFSLIHIRTGSHYKMDLASHSVRLDERENCLSVQWIKNWRNIAYHSTLILSRRPFHCKYWILGAFSRNSEANRCLTWKLYFQRFTKAFKISFFFLFTMFSKQQNQSKWTCFILYSWHYFDRLIFMLFCRFLFICMAIYSLGFVLLLKKRFGDGAG